MIGKLLGFVGGLLTSDKASDTFIDIVRDKTGVDNLKDSERVNALLEWVKNTKHQSGTRRFLAIATMLGIVFFTTLWSLVFSLESLYVFLTTDTTSLQSATTTANIAKIAVQPLTQFRNGIMTMLTEFYVYPATVVFGFYFGSQLTNVMKQGK